MIIPIILYAVSYGLMILNKGIYWDDWTFYGLPLEKHGSIFSQYGAPWRTYIDILILSLPENVQVFHLLTFFSYLAALIFLYKILQSIKSIDTNSRIIITTIFAILPVNMLRVSFVTFSYTLSYVLFFFGFWITSLFVKTKKIFYRIISLLAFFLSFTTFSFLPFYAIIIIYLYYRFYDNNKRRPRLPEFFFQHLDFIGIPFLFWILRSQFLKPYGLYADYNRISISGLTQGIIHTLAGYNVVLFELIKACIRSIDFSVFLVGSILIYQILKRNFHTHSINTKNSARFFFVGLLIFFLGSYPYYASGHVMSNDFWDNRHQLLTPLGASFIIYFGLQLFFRWQKINHRIQLYIYSVLLILFVNYNFIITGQYFRDWYKQKSIVHHMNNQPEFLSATTFIFKDNVKDLNVLNRLYAFYEYTGLMKHVFHDEKRFALDFDSYKDLKRAIPAQKEDINSYYSTSEYTPIPPQYIIEINRGDYILGWKNLFRLIWAENFNKNLFNETIPHIITFSLKNFTD